MLRRLRVHVALLVILVVAAGSGAVGLDFGRHWDEPERIGTVIHAVERGELLPAWYNYPSVVHDLILLSASPDLLRHSVLPAATGKPGPQGAFRAALQAHGFLLRTRALIFSLTLLAIAGAYGLVWEWRRSLFEAAVAAGLVGLSWEIGYHARWIAPDVLTAAFAALSLWALERARRGEHRVAWLAAAGAAAGLACGAKYPSGLLLIPLLVGAVESWRTGRAGLLRAVGAVVAGFVVAYLISTPGTLLQYERFLGDVRFEIKHYHTGHGGGHTIVPGWPHARAELLYLATVVFSPFRPVACIFTGLAASGAVHLLRKDRWRAALLLGFPIVYVAYMSTQSVMVARNLLVVVPFLAALGARGAGACRDAVARFHLGPALVVFAAAALLSVNGGWLVSAGVSCRSQAPPFPQALAFLSRPSTPPCALSPRLLAEVRQSSSVLPACAARSEGEPPVWVAFHATEVPSPSLWTANRPGYLVESFGPREVNLNYDPSWIGKDHSLVMRREDALPLGLAVR